VTRANAYLAPGTHIVRLAANSDGFNLNWISFTAAAAVGKAVPGTIQAEDFNDAGFWDSTPGNSGNSYRATDVDIERTTDAGGGFNIGWIEAGEWQEYTITVAAAGYYDFSVRVASREQPCITSPRRWRGRHRQHDGSEYRRMAGVADADPNAHLPDRGRSSAAVDGDHRRLQRELDVSAEKSIAAVSRP
jgi:hypothetical protein